MQQTDNTELPNNTASEGNGQAANTNSDNSKELQAEYTRVRQNEINLAIKLAEKDKKSILEIQDKKLQNKVVKELYGLDNIDEVKLIHGDNFYIEKSNNEDGDDEDEIDRIKKELTLLKYNQAKSKIEEVIEDYKKENKDLFLDGEAENKLREELKYISSDLPERERIKRASKIVFGINTTDAAYISLIQNSGVGGKSNKDDIKQKTNIEDEFKKIFKRK